MSHDLSSLTSTVGGSSPVHRTSRGSRRATNVLRTNPQLLESLVVVELSHKMFLFLTQVRLLQSAALEAEPQAHRTASPTPAVGSLESIPPWARWNAILLKAKDKLIWQRYWTLKKMKSDTKLSLFATNRKRKKMKTVSMNATLGGWAHTVDRGVPRLLHWSWVPPYVKII